MDGSNNRGAIPPAELTGRHVSSGDGGASAKAGDITDRLKELDPEDVAASSLRAKLNRPAPRRSAAPAAKGAKAAKADRSQGERKAVPDDIADYWSELRNGLRYPSHDALDLTTIAINWPNCLLLQNAGGAFQPDTTFMQRMRAQHPSRYGIKVEPIEFSSMVIEWIVAAGLKAAKSGRAQRMSEVFSVKKKPMKYQVVALPLSEDQKTIDHVLCHVSLS